MTDQAEQARALARELILQARAELWPYLNLSPRIDGTGQRRQGFEALAHLKRLPDELEELARCDFIELRGTQVEDLSSLRSLSHLREVNFVGIPACEEDAELKAISEIEDSGERMGALLALLAQREPARPPEPVEGGPRFHVPLTAPITLADTPLGVSDDYDDVELLHECREKADALDEIAELANNVAPRLSPAIKRYKKHITRLESEIGARTIWSIANTLDSIWQVHQRAELEHRINDELPPRVASCLQDLLETHRVWFLGHPGARDVFDRVRQHGAREDAAERRELAVKVVEAAEHSSAVSPQATGPARENIEASTTSTLAGVAALGELEDWAWNFISAVTRKVWHLAKKPPGGFLSQTVGGYYLIEFIVAHEPALRAFIFQLMPHGPIWWEALLTMIRRSQAEIMKDGNQP